MSFFDKENSLELLSYASKEIVDYVNFEVAELSQYYVNIILAIATFITLLTINPYLAAWLPDIILALLGAWLYYKKVYTIE